MELAVRLYRIRPRIIRLDAGYWGLQLIHWIHKDYGLSSLDAYELLSKVAKIHLDEMVDPNYVVVASIDKKFLPARKK